MQSAPRLAWLRIGDLRLRDNPALAAAASGAGAVVPVFAWCPKEEQAHACPRSAGERNWGYEGTTIHALLAPALANLDAAFAKRGGVRLRLLQSEDSTSAELVLRFAEEVGAKEIHLNRREEPVERRREVQLQQLASKQGITVKMHSAFLFRDPERCRIFQAIQRGMHIFKAFWAGWHQGGEVRPQVAAPATMRSLSGQRNDLPFAGDADADWPFAGPMPTCRVTGRPLREHSVALSKIWDISEEGAETAFQEFQKLEGGLARYKGSITRDAGPKAKESKLSLYFRLGLLSMVDVWWRVDHSSEQAKKWLRRCAWRDYAYWMLRYWPDLPEVPMRLAYRNLTWLRDSHDDAVEAWRCGRTGFPLVDAGMRELRNTGYLQQNLRHTVGQFLVETLGVDWRVGEEWFHITLVDSDLAINAMMWQHQGLAGVSQWLVGIDCHPKRHAKAADPKGEYVRYWVPELSKLPLQYLHCPGEAPKDVLEKAGVRLGVTYPHPIVADVDEARAVFLDHAKECRSTADAACFSSDGADLLAPPSEPSPLGASPAGIWALTERRFKSGAKAASAPKAETRGTSEKGKGKSKRRWNDDGWNNGWSGGWGNSWTEGYASYSTNDSSWQQPVQEEPTASGRRRWNRARGAK